jgi:hypothetical protein
MAVSKLNVVFVPFAEPVVPPAAAPLPPEPTTTVYERVRSKDVVPVNKPPAPPPP